MWRRESRRRLVLFEFGQDLSTVQSSLIRIDPRAAGESPYRVPTDNPFLQANDPLDEIPDEIFANGFRNPSTLAFTVLDGKLLLGDIAQNTIEEVNLIERGHNYGWGIQEGTFLYTDLTDTDRSLRYIPLGDGSDRTNIRFGQDADGEIYIASKTNGVIYRFENLALHELAGDLDTNGFVEGRDFLQWQRDGHALAVLSDWQVNFGIGLKPTVASQLPEPHAYLLVMTAAVLVTATSRVGSARVVSPSYGGRTMGSPDAKMYGDGSGTGD